jgi:hypothetical protein
MWATYVIPRRIGIEADGMSGTEPQDTRHAEIVEQHHKRLLSRSWDVLASVRKVRQELDTIESSMEAIIRSEPYIDVGQALTDSGTTTRLLEIKTALEDAADRLSDVTGFDDY